MPSVISPPEPKAAKRVLGLATLARNRNFRLLGNGYLAITLITWLQKRTPKHLLGRIMSLMLFASYGLVPVAQVLCGGLIKWSLAGVFSIAGVLILVVAVRVVVMPEIRAMGTEIERETGSRPAT